MEAEPRTKAERFQYAQQQSGISTYNLAERMGVSPKALYKWYSGETKNPEDEQLIRFALLTRFSPRWLVFGDGPKRLGDNPILDEIENSSLDAETKMALLKQALEFTRWRIRELKAS